jgi:copper transporter 1
MHHAGMDHGDMDHGDMDMGNKCSMNMLFTWSFKNLCIVFPRWHITGIATLIVSLLVIVLLSACYEAVRNLARRYEVSLAQRLKAYMGPVAADGEIADESATTPRSAAPAAIDAPINDVSRRNETSSQLIVGRDGKKALERKGRVILAALYAVQVFYSFFIMLLFMTYNGWIMLAVTVGAFIGYLVFGESTAAKSVACH